MARRIHLLVILSSDEGGVDRERSRETHCHARLGSVRSVCQEVAGGPLLGGEWSGCLRTRTSAVPVCAAPHWLTSVVLFTRELESGSHT